jgi:hypothetical protein
MRQLRTYFAALLAAACLALPVVARAADTIPPAAPQNFEATVAKGSPTVTLSWTAAVDAGGVKSYRLDRSLDRVAWKTLSDTITATQYQDTTAGYGLHYFFRLSAIDTSGNSSDWVTAEAALDDVASAGAGSTEANYTSSDKRATALLPAGLAAGEISCTVDSLVSVKKIGTNSQPAVAGPYGLSCRTTADSIVTEYKKPVTWVVDLKGKLQGLNNPVAYAYGADGQQTLLRDAQFDAKAETIRVSAPADRSIGILASRPRTIVSLSWIIIILTVAGVVAGIVILAMNRKKKLEYEEYIRSKYYEL